MRLYTHLVDARGCEAPGCAVRTCSLYRQAGGWVKACTPAHAQDADRRLERQAAGHDALEENPDATKD